MIVHKLSLLLLFCINCLFSHADDTYCDSLIKIKPGDERLILLEDYIVEVAYQNEKKLEELTAWVQKNGSESEKILVGLQWKLKAAPSPFSEASLRIVDTHLEKARTANSNLLMAILYYIKADILFNRQEYNEGIEHYLFCYDYLKKDPKNKFYNECYFLYKIAEQLYLYKDFEKSITIALEAARLTPKKRFRSWFTMANAHLISMAYLHNKNYSNALHWQQVAYHSWKKEEYPEWEGILKGSLGLIQYEQGNIKEAILNLDTAIVICKKFDVHDNIAPLSVKLAHIYLNNGQPQVALPLLQLARQSYYADTSQSIENLAAYYDEMQRYYKINKDFLHAMAATDSSKIYHAQYEKTYNINRKALAEGFLAYSLKDAETKLIKAKLLQSKYLLLGSIFIGCSLLLAVVFYHKKQRLQHQLKREKLEHEKLKLEDELQFALKEIKDTTLHLVQKNELIAQYSDEINKLQASNNSITDADLEAINKLRKASVLTDEDWDNFRELFEKVHPGYLMRLKKEYPDLTPAETRYIVFAKLNISSKEMMVILGISPEAVRNIRFRLKKKLKLEENLKIETLVNTI